MLPLSSFCAVLPRSISSLSCHVASPSPSQMHASSHASLIFFLHALFAYYLPTRNKGRLFTIASTMPPSLSTSAHHPLLFQPAFIFASHLATPRQPPACARPAHVFLFFFFATMISAVLFPAVFRIFFLLSFSFFFFTIPYRLPTFPPAPDIFTLAVPSISFPPPRLPASYA